MDDLNRAVSLYVGWKISPFPKEDGARVLDHFGRTDGAMLLESIDALIRELQALQPNWDEHDLVGASKWAVDELASRHPQITAEGKAALEWLYSWWWK